MRDLCSTCGSLHDCSIGKYQGNKKYWVLLCPQKIGRQRPNTIESIIDDGTPDNCIYVGNGQFWVKIGKRMRNPDFIIENSNKVIELFGDYWHRNDDPDSVIQEYESIGFDCLIIWEKEIRKDRKRVFNLIRSFEAR